MPYWQLFYHLVWATKQREPLLTAQIEPLVHGFIRSKVIGLGGTLFALNGMADHVHVVTAIPPAISVARFVGQLKGVSSARYNKSCPSQVLYWQDEYGAFSFDAKRLPHFVAYVECQKEHHAENTIIAVLERAANANLQLLREVRSQYTPGDSAWRDEFVSLAD